MKLSLGHEKYPHWFISTRAETAENFGEEYTAKYFRGVEVPDHVARRWLHARREWAAVEEEIEAFLKGKF